MEKIYYFSVVQTYHLLLCIPNIYKINKFYPIVFEPLIYLKLFFVFVYTLRKNLVPFFSYTDNQF